MKSSFALSFISFCLIFSAHCSPGLEPRTEPDYDLVPHPEEADSSKETGETPGRNKRNIVFAVVDELVKGPLGDAVCSTEFDNCFVQGKNCFCNCHFANPPNPTCSVECHIQCAKCHGLVGLDENIFGVCKCNFNRLCMSSVKTTPC